MIDNMCCDLCDFQEDLPNWVKNNSNLDATQEENYCNRVLSVLHSFGEYSFDVSAGFAFREIKRDGCVYNLAHVYVKGEYNDNSILVEFYPFSAVYVICSQHCPGLDHCNEHKFENMCYAKYVDDHLSKNWEQSASIIIDAAIAAISDKIEKDHDEDEKALLRQVLGGKEHV